MRTRFYNATILLFTILTFVPMAAQDTKEVDFYNQIKNYDLSAVLMADSFLSEDSENNTDKISRPEILGFLGDNYQRFQIHFISIIQNPNNPYEYLAFGKTKVKEAVCNFQGTITIKESSTANNEFYPAYREGIAKCEVVLYEDSKQPSTGYFKGILNCGFIIDAKGKFRYDGLMYASDGFCNNSFKGSWISYKTKSAKKCHWGDFRIPDSGDLDIGAGEFSLNSKYAKNGWETYRAAWCCDPELPETKKAKQKEAQHWWK